MDKASIVNLALAELGDLTQTKRMTAFTVAGCNGFPAAIAALEFYQPCKEQMLAALDWERARKVVALGAAATAGPLLDGYWTYKYARPADCLILRKVVDDSEKQYPFKQMAEGGDEWIYCNETDVFAVYTFDVGEERYNVGMVQLHALYLAERLASTVTGNNIKTMLIAQKIQEWERKYIALGAKEGYVADEDGTSKPLVGFF